MFFILGAAPGQKKLAFSQLVGCPCCGRFGRVEIYVTYTVLSLFFLPVLKWGRRYFARMACCGAQCELPAELGRAAERGSLQTRDVSSLHFGSAARTRRRCPACGFATEEDFSFCPQCGRPF